MGLDPSDDRPPVIVVTGPTASGKTDLAVALLDELDAEIVSVDSAMVYRGLDIGTAKPGPELLARAPHRLIDIRDPEQAYSAADFCTDALEAMTEITATGRIPLLVGGTMLYLEALEHGLSALPSADAGIRRRIEAEAAEQGWSALHARLERIDPTAARRIHPNDPQRIQRALEVYELTGRPLSAQQSRSRRPLPWRFVHIVLGFSDRLVLHERIERRLDTMLAAGLLDEVECLRARPGMSAELPAARAVGYRQLWHYLDGLTSLDAAVRDAKTATRRLAKRQMTWLRRSWTGHVFEASDDDLHEQALNCLHRASIL